jgi:hypothetical protein
MSDLLSCIQTVRLAGGGVYQRRKKASKHGHTDGGLYSPTYHSWQAMLARCRYEHRDAERKYAGRGIGVCERWAVFENFLADMGERPAGMTLDRADNNKGYEPGNCRWASPVDQARNRRNARLDYEAAFEIALRLFGGERASDLAREFGISESLPREIFKGRTWNDARNAAEERYYGAP